MAKRGMWYAKKGISKARYEELKAVALQYDEYVSAERKLRLGEIDRERSGNSGFKPKDPTGNAAIMLATRSVAPRIRAIEESARTAAACREMQQHLMRNVTRGESWEIINPPMGRRQFYALRRRFFVELNDRI